MFIRKNLKRTGNKRVNLFLDKKFINAVGFVLTNLLMEVFVVLCNEIGSNILKAEMNHLFNPNRATKKLCQ